MDSSEWNGCAGGDVNWTSDEDMESITDMALLRCHRLSSMTDGCGDPAITERILQEKEKDLELAARIGKVLLQRNEELQRKNEVLEEQMGYASDQVTQLKHELQKKSDLLRVFTDDENGETSSDFKRTQERRSSGHLHRRIRLLEEENSTLKSEINKLKALTGMLRDKEDQIVGEFLKKIAEIKRQMKALHTDWQEKQEECEVKESKIHTMNKKIADKTKNELQLKDENEMLTARLRIVQGIQADLAQELLDLQERYAEVVSMLTSAKEELNDAQTMRSDTRCSKWSAPEDSLYDSLASELEMSDSGYSANYKAPYSYTPASTGDRTIAHAAAPLQNSNPAEPISKKLEAEDVREQYAIECQDDTDDAMFDPIESDLDASEKAKGIMRSIEAALESPLEKGSVLCKYNTRVGVPGTPGSKDLELAIERLAQRREINEPLGPDCPIGDNHNLSSASHQRSKTPPRRAKLMLVVPVEGSKSLEHWRQLATPSGIDPRSWEKMPGINVKNGFGISNSPKFATARKQYSVSSIFANMNLPSPSLSKETNEAEGTSTTASFPVPLMTSRSSSQLLQPDAKRVLQSDCASKNHSDASTKPKGLSLTERCAGLLHSVGGSWLTYGKSQYASNEFISTSDCKKTGGNRKSAVPGRGLFGSLCDLREEQTDFNHGVVMRAGLNL